MMHSNPKYFGRRSHEEVRVRTLIGAAESLRNGITTIQDFLTVEPQEEAYVDTVLSAYAEAGIRVVIAIAARDRGALDIAPFFAKNLPESIQRRLAGQDRRARDELAFVAGQIARLGMAPTELQRWALAPSGPQRCSAELLEGIAALSREHGLPVLTHVYETRVQAAAAQDATGSLTDKLARAGLMNDRLAVVHGVWLSPRHIAQIADAGAGVVHNNLKLKSGVAPILDLYRAGIDIALGCDNCSCADSLCGRGPCRSPILWRSPLGHLGSAQPFGFRSIRTNVAAGGREVCAYRTAVGPYRKMLQSPKICHFIGHTEGDHHARDVLRFDHKAFHCRRCCRRHVLVRRRDAGPGAGRFRHSARRGRAENALGRTRSAGHLDR
jgi:hypothetical protein